jgi:hypothetical protein
MLWSPSIVIGISSNVIFEAIATVRSIESKLSQL